MNTLDKFRLDGKVCVITGGAGFLGVKHAEALLDAGARVIVVDVNKDKLNSVIATDLKGNKYAMGFQFDITDEHSVMFSVKHMWGFYGPISVLINNAANNPVLPNPESSRFENFDYGIWRRDFDVNVTGAFFMSREVGKRMAENGGGVVLNIVSDLGVIAPDQRIYKQEGVDESKQPVKPVTYSVTKHALIGLTKYLATYWVDKGIRVNSLSPGGVYNGHPDEFVQRLSNLIPMNRMANIDEYKAAIVFLCSDASSYMTGANLVIDGGRTCW